MGLCGRGLEWMWGCRRESVVWSFSYTPDDGPKGICLITAVYNLCITYIHLVSPQYFRKEIAFKNRQKVVISRSFRNSTTN